jgi:hypothetical protein
VPLAIDRRCRIRSRKACNETAAYFGKILFTINEIAKVFLASRICFVDPRFGDGSGAIGGTLTSSITFTTASAPVVDASAQTVRSSLMSQFNGILSPDHHHIAGCVVQRR